MLKSGSSKQTITCSCEIFGNLKHGWRAWSLNWLAQCQPRFNWKMGRPCEDIWTIFVSVILNHRMKTRSPWSCDTPFWRSPSSSSIQCWSTRTTRSDSTSWGWSCSKTITSPRASCSTTPSGLWTRELDHYRSWNSHLKLSECIYGLQIDLELKGVWSVITVDVLSM